MTYVAIWLYTLYHRELSNTTNTLALRPAQIVINNYSKCQQLKPDTTTVPPAASSETACEDREQSPGFVTQLRTLQQHPATNTFIVRHIQQTMSAETIMLMYYKHRLSVTWYCITIMLYNFHLFHQQTTV